MTTIVIETWIDAPPERCFDLARSLRAHEATTGGTREVVVDAPPYDLLEDGDSVTFEATHLFARRRLTARITAFEAPHRFVDEMVSGDFRSLWHEHRFSAVRGGCQMTDRLVFSAPFGPLGWIAERLFLASYMRRFLQRRTQALKAMAEKPDGLLKS